MRNKQADILDFVRNIGSNAADRLGKITRGALGISKPQGGALGAALHHNMPAVLPTPPSTTPPTTMPTDRLTGPR